MNIKLIGVPLNYGANKCGLEYGIENFIEKYPNYKKDIEIIKPRLKTEDFNRKKLKFLNTIVDTCERLANKIDEEREEETIPITIGGDHSISIGSIAGISARKKVGLLWVDAHADFNTEETTETGHIHGMPLGALCGYGEKKLVDCYYKGAKLDVKDVVLFGIRSVDKKERKLLNESGVRYYEWEEIESRGFETCLKEVSDFLESRGIEVHLSFDLDSVNPKEILGVSTPVVGGFSKNEGLEIIKYIFKNNTVASMDIVEYNPLYEKNNETSEYINKIIEEVKAT